MSFIAVAETDSLWSGEMVGVQIGAVKVLLVNVGGQVHAYEDKCAHKAVELSRGKLEGALLTCPVHEWQYDVTTGAGINPRSARLRRFPLKLEGNQILVDVSDG